MYVHMVKECMCFRNDFGRGGVRIVMQSKIIVKLDIPQKLHVPCYWCMDVTKQFP